jgi:hypothetical protein
MVAAWDVGALNLGSGHVCAHCSQELEVLEEALLLQVAYPAKPNGSMEYYIAEDEQGEFFYEPYFFHLSCWEEEVENSLYALRDDEPPVLDERGIVECDGCTSHILPWELSGVLTLGEFQRATRAPDGSAGISFVPFDTVKERPYCISCLTLINEEVLEMWENGITHRGACEEGVHARCWRYACCEEPGKTGCRLFNDVAD